MRSLTVVAAVVVTALAGAAPAVAATAGSLDTAFHGTGVRTDQLDLGAGTPFSFYESVVALPDGSVRALATEDDASDLSKVTVTGLDAGGSLSGSWAGTGIARNAAFAPEDPADIPYTQIGGATLTPDGKLIVAGRGGVDDFNMRDEGFIQRYRTDGTLDSTFGVAGTVRFTVPSPLIAHEAGFGDVAVDSAGRIVAVGADNALGSPNGQSLIVRLKPDGTLDTTFGGTGYVTAQYDTVPPLDSHWSAVEIAPGDGFVLLGSAPGAVIARVSEAGLRDLSYGPDGFAHIPDLSTSDTGQKKTLTTGLALLPDGRVVVGGGASWRQGAGFDFDVFESWMGRFTATGVLDPAFDGDGIARWRFGADGAGTWADSFIRDLAVQANGAVVALTQSGSTDGDTLGTIDGLAIRVRPDGSLDPLFGTAGQAPLALAPAGKRTLLGALALAPGRRILAGGGIQDAGGTTAAGVARLIGDGDPVAKLTAPAQGVAGKPVTLDASASVDDWLVSAYAWDLNGDGVFGDTTGAAVTPVLPLGTHTVAVRVTDDGGHSTTASATVKVLVPFTVKLPASLKLQGTKLKVPVTCAKPGPCKGSLTLSIKVKAKAARLVTVRVGRASFSLRGGQRKRVSVTLARRVRRTVARRGTARVTVAVRASGVSDVLQRQGLVVRR